MVDRTQGDEWFEIVDEDGRPQGLARRRDCHGDPALLHRTAHVLVVDAAGRLYLQRRALDKDIQPGKWDTSVGGHLQPGEDSESAARREMREELGIAPDTIAFCYRYGLRSPVESELVDTYQTRWDGALSPAPGEISEGRFWTVAEIEACLGTGCFTPNFEDEYRRWRRFLQEGGGRSGTEARHGAGGPGSTDRNPKGQGGGS